MDHVHGIGAVSKRTGLSPHVIRAWERRYRAVEPIRSEGNQRLYSDGDITRLILLRRATEQGMSISRAVQLDDEAVRSYLLSGGSGQVAAPRKEAPEAERSMEQLIDEAVELVHRVDPEALTSLLRQATVDHGVISVLDTFIAPFLQRIGSVWRAGELRIYHEHVASSVVRTFLGGVLESHRVDPDRPALLATTPRGQRHELGAILCAAVAATEQVRGLYLGPDTPAEEIIRAATLEEVRFVALSIHFPEGDRQVLEELTAIRESITEETMIIIGGAAAPWYHERVDSHRIVLLDSMRELREILIRR